MSGIAIIAIAFVATDTINQMFADPPIRPPARPSASPGPFPLLGLALLVSLFLMGCDNEIQPSGRLERTVAVASDRDHTLLSLRTGANAELRLWTTQKEVGSNSVDQIYIARHTTNHQGTRLGRLSEPTVLIDGTAGELGFEFTFPARAGRRVEAQRSEYESKTLSALVSSNSGKVDLTKGWSANSNALILEPLTAADDYKRFNRAPALQIFEKNFSTEIREGENTTLEVALAFEPRERVVLEVVPGDPGALEVNPGVLIFTANNWHVRRQIILRGVDDERVDREDLQKLTIRVNREQSDLSYGYLPRIDIQIPVADRRVPVPGASNMPVLRILSFAGYVESILASFEREYGIRTEVDHVSSTDEYEEAIRSGIAAGQPYDVVIPSHYSVLRLSSEGLIERLDKRLLGKAHAAIDRVYSHYLKQRLGEEGQRILRYSIPYLVSAAGGCYHAAEFPNVPTHWRQFFVERDRGPLDSQMLLLDEARVVLATVMLMQQSEPITRVESALRRLTRIRNGLASLPSEAPILTNLIEISAELQDIADGIQANRAAMYRDHLPTNSLSQLPSISQSLASGVEAVNYPLIVTNLIGIITDTNGLMAGLGARHRLTQKRPGPEYVNTTNEVRIKAAASLLKSLVRSTRVIFDQTDAGPRLARGETYLGLAWSGDASGAMSENRDIRFVSPSPGGIMVMDCLAIGAGAKNRLEAITFIEYLLKDKVAAAVTRHSDFANTVPRSRLYVPATILNGPAYFLPSVEDAYLLGGIDENSRNLYHEEWKKIKAMAGHFAGYSRYQFVYRGSLATAE